MDNPASIDGLLIFAIGAAASLPLAALSVYGAVAVYSGAKSAGQKILYKDDDSNFYVLCRKDLRQFFAKKRGKISAEGRNSSGQFSLENCNSI